MIPAANLISLICVILYRTLTSIGNRKLFDQVHFSGYRVWKSLLITRQSVPYHYFELIRKILLEETLVSLYEHITGGKVSVLLGIRNISKTKIISEVTKWFIVWSFFVLIQ